MFFPLVTGFNKVLVTNRPLRGTAHRLSVVPIRTLPMPRVPLMPRLHALILLWDIIYGQTTKAESETESPEPHALPTQMQSSHVFTLPHDLVLPISEKNTP